MAKARKDAEAVNVVTKETCHGLSSDSRGGELEESGRDRNRSNIHTSRHSRYQTLEEILYSLDTKGQSSSQVRGETMDGNPSRTARDNDKGGIDATKEDVSVGATASLYTSKTSQSGPNDMALGDTDKSEETVKVKKARLKDTAVLDLDAFLNDDSDLEDAVSIEDLQARRRLLDYQLQRRIEQYYMEDLDLESLNAEDFGRDLDIWTRGSRNFNPQKPDYPQSMETEEECSICFEVLIVQKRWCCDFLVCNSCMDQYLEVKVSQGVVKISCINGGCTSYIHREEIYDRLSQEMRDKFYRFLVNANQDPHIKTCPKCSHVYNETELGSDNRHKFGQLVVCPECKLNWCFHCHAPWHFGTKCKDFQKGDKLVKRWAKEQHFGVNNAQKCPKCKVRDVL